LTIPAQRSLRRPYIGRSSFGQVVRTSLPIVVDLASQILMWTIEATLVGRIPHSLLADFGPEVTGAVALTAVGNVVQIIIFTFTIFLTFVVGATLVINRFLGAGRYRVAHHFFGQAIFMTVVSSLFVAAGWFFLARPIFAWILGAPSGAVRVGIHYFRIVALFLPFILLNFVMLGIIRGAGRTRVSMSVNLLINGLHLLLAVGLIFGNFGLPALGVTGAALAGATAHTLGCVVTLTLVAKGKCLLRPRWKDLRALRVRTLRDIFGQGFPTTVEQLFWTGGITGVLLLSNRLGSAAAAAQVILITIQRLLSMIYQALGLGTMTLVGQHHGSKRPREVERTVVFFSLVGGGSTLVLATVFFLLARPIVNLFTREPDLVEAGAGLLKVLAVVQIPKALTNVFGSALRGVGDVRFPMYLTVIGVVVFELALGATLAFTIGIGLLGFWIAMGIDEGFRTGLNARRFRRGDWR
jgi:putative MATE family efflux protein